MPELDATQIPRHVAIIMDGNGRWAKERGFLRTAGHREGIKRVREIVRAAAEIGIGYVTFFAFSTENWNRSRSEVSVLLKFLGMFLQREVAQLNKSGVRLKFIGLGDPIPPALQKKMRAAEDCTAHNSRLTMVLALNYGARQEIVEACKVLARQVKSGILDPEAIDTDMFSGSLWTHGIPDPDLLIRTSAELRLSNFLLWQLSYAELYFPETYWPDFHRKDLERAIGVYQSRSRRFGKEGPEHVR